MTTLLERIADMAACVGGNVEEVLVEAANEIERLRAEVQTWKQQSESYWEKIEAMEKQEPVAWMDRHGTLYNSVSHVRPSDKPLYALPGAQQCKNCNGMGDRFDPSGEKIPCDLCESNLEEIRALVAEAAHDIISGGDFWLSTSLAAKKIYAIPGAQPAPSVPTALLVAVADLVAQMEITARVGFVDTPDDKDSCAAFCVAEGTWLELMSCVESLAASLAAIPEAKPCP